VVAIISINEKKNTALNFTVPNEGTDIPLGTHLELG